MILCYYITYLNFQPPSLDLQNNDLTQMHVQKARTK